MRLWAGPGTSPTPPPYRSAARSTGGSTSCTAQPDDPAGRSPRRPPAPTCSYLRLAAPALCTWYEDGITDRRAVTVTHIKQALEPVQGEAAKSRATALRSLFRALKREKLIFRDPARNVSLTTAVVLPRPLADDMLRGTLDRLPNSRDRLSLVLAAVHALSTHDQRHLLLDDLDHSRATLRVRRTGKPVHTVYLDELTYRPARQWFAATSPYMLVTVRTTTDDTRPRCRSRRSTSPCAPRATRPAACAWTASSTRPSTATTPSTSSASSASPPALP
ncbi:hypothetical protein [Streptomyces sp. NPDC001100]